MSTSAEQFLAAAALVITAAVAAYSSTVRVDRGRADPLGLDELPAINLRRGPLDLQAWANDLDQATLVFEVDIEVRGDDWETQADALHQLINQALSTSATLASMVRGIRCTGVEPDAEPGDTVAGRFQARYQCQFITRRGALTPQH